MSIEAEVWRLNGFLEALGIVGGRQSRVSASWYPSDGDAVTGLATFLKERRLKHADLIASAISRETFLAESLGVLGVADLPDSVQGDLEWQFEEYFGLMSTALGPTYPFSPLFKCPLTKVRVEGAYAGRALLVNFGPAVVALFCEDRA